MSRVGFVRIVGPNDACRQNETALDWNVQGMQGPPGPAGPQGLQGPAEAPGISGYEVVTAASAYDSKFLHVAEARCPAGKRAIGGGAYLIDDQRYALGSSAPWPVGAPGTAPNAWRAAATRLPSATERSQLVAVVICATVAP
ncbi:MAG: hypothetical protein HY332_22190 [Chloroflexi bacterium]|nr:hypothetical protein [Chloroflexota bacterium]